MAHDASVVLLRPCDPTRDEDEVTGAGRVQFQSRLRNLPYVPYPDHPAQVFREVVMTPPPGVDAAGRMLHALRVEVEPETTLVVDARLLDGHSRWTLLYTRGGMLVAHRQESYF